MRLPADDRSLLTRRQWLTRAAALTGGWLAAGGLQPAAAALTKVTILEGGRVIGWAPAHLALERGLFRAEGLDVEYVTSAQGATPAVAAVVSGSAFMSFTGSPVPMSAALKGSPIRIVLVVSGEYGAEFTVSNQFLKSRGVTPQSPLDQKVTAFRGAKIAIYSPGDSTDQLAQYLFRKFGINPDRELELVSTKNAPNMLATFQRGAVDVMIVSPPTGQQAESQGLGKVYLSPAELPELRGYPYLVGAAHLKDIEQRPQLVRGAIKAVARAEQMLRRDPVSFKADIRKYFEKFDPKVFDLAYDAAVKAVPPTPVPTREGFAAIESFVKGQGKSVGLTYEQAIDPRLAEQAVKELGG